MTDLPRETDILIAGAGPAGLALAVALRQAGAAPVVIEKRPEPALTSRAAVIHSKTLEMLDALEVTPHLLAEGLKVPVFRVRDRDRVLMEVDFSELHTRYPFTLMCPQERTEAILTDRFDALDGRIWRGVELTGAEFRESGAEVLLRQGEETRNITAKWIVGCDGSHSVVREKAAVVFEGGAYEQSFVLADVRMDWPLPRDEISLFFSPAGLVVIAPLPGDRFRIVATVDEAPERPDAAFMERLVAERGPSGARASIREMVWSSRFKVAHRVAASFVRGRAVLCGDAAHVHSPAGGQGMNTGIQDAITLAAPLLHALRSGSQEPLEAWAEARRHIAEDVVAVTDRMTRAATLQSPAARLVRNAAIGLAGHIPGVPHKIARKLAELDRD